MPVFIHKFSTLSDKRIKVSELIGKNSWWEGPEYLRCLGSEWPANKIFKRSEQVKSEVKKEIYVY